jgi:GMP synthase (glutamine-hydrolysing)
MAKIYVIQHHPAEGLGVISKALEESALAWQLIRTYEDHSIPKEMKGGAGLIVMGGPLSVYEQDSYAHLRDELRLIEAALRQNRPVLGVCLGSQLIAAALGAKVCRGPLKEIGWHEVRLSQAALEDRLFGAVPRRFTAMHWHGDIFDLPNGAVNLASSQRTEHQAFRYGVNVYGILCHLELTGAMIQQWVGAFSRDLEREKIASHAILDRAEPNIDAIAPIAQTVFGRWAALIDGPA